MYAQVVVVAQQTESFLEKLFPQIKVAITGGFKQQHEIIHQLDFVIATPLSIIENVMAVVEGFSFKEKQEDHIIYTSSVGINVKMFSCTEDNFFEKIDCKFYSIFKYDKIYRLFK